MMREKLVFALSLFVLLASLFHLRFSSANVKASNGYPIHNVDTGLSYTIIQAAIDAPETLDGHTVHVEAGTYYENILINKRVSLTGDNKDTTVIDGSGIGNVVSLEASNVVLSGFTLRNSGIGSSGNPYCGVRLVYSHDSLINDNVIVDNEYGVWLSYSNYNTISGNVVECNNLYGVRLYQSKNNTLVCNYMVDNEYGIYVYASSEANVVRCNNLSRNTFGLYFGLSDGNLVEGNTVVNSSLYGITLRKSGGNFVFHNNFVGNRLQADLFDAFANVWDDRYPSGGNYWSDYNGVDEFYGAGQNMSGSDGLGDTEWGNDVDNQDRYPLMGLFNRFEVIWNGSAYPVLTVCSSIITGFSLGFPELSVEIRLNVSGVEGTKGFCRVCVPKVFLEDLENDEYLVIVNGDSSILTSQLESEGEYDILYFTYVNGPFIPEFTPAFMMLLFLFLTFVILLIRLAADKKQAGYGAMG